MKKILMIVFSLMIVISVNGQMWKGFFKPLDHVVMQNKALLPGSKGDIQFLVRPDVYLNAIMIQFNGKEPLSNPLSAVGFGASVGKYVTDPAGTYCPWAVTGSILTKMTIGESSSAKLGLSVTGEFLNRFIGAGPVVYFEGGKANFGLNINVTYNW
jgi:hypothetical protein